MFNKTFKTAFAALAIVAGAASFSPAMAAGAQAPAGAANAGNLHLASGSIHIQTPHGGIYFGHGRGPGWYGKPQRRHYGGRRHGGRHYGGRRVCHPRKAVRKAWHIGMNRPGIRRIGENRIVVTGWHRGHRAKLVFDRWSPRCRVIRARGI